MAEAAIVAKKQAKPRRKKHVPARTCVVCRETRPKRELTRLVRTSEGKLALDPGAKMPGRGAYLCQKTTCWLGASRGKMLAQALRAPLSDEDRAMLEVHAAELDEIAKMTE